MDASFRAKLFLTLKKYIIRLLIHMERLCFVGRLSGGRVYRHDVATLDTFVDSMGERCEPAFAVCSGTCMHSLIVGLVAKVEQEILQGFDVLPL